VTTAGPERPVLANGEIAARLSEIADLLEIKGDNPFRIRAYRNAAGTIAEYPESVASLAMAGRVREVPGIGEGIAAQIRELADGGEIALRAELLAEFPAGLVELLQVPGLGAKRARQIHDALGVDGIEALEAAARAGRLRELPGFGAKSEAAILAGIQQTRELDERAGEMLVGRAWAAVDALGGLVAAIPGVAVVHVAGELRRGPEMVKGVALVAVVEDGAAVAAALRAAPQVAEVTESPASTSGVDELDITLQNGVSAWLGLCPAERLGAVRVWRTGDDAFLAALADRAKQHGLRLDGTGLWRGGAALAAPEEAAVFAALDLPPIPCELRWGSAIVDQAAAGALPALIEPTDVQADLQLHTTWSDGQASLEEMAAAVEARGYTYVAITDHSQGLGIVQGLTPERAREQIAAIRALSASGRFRAHLLAGVELEILSSGLALPDEVLAEFDIVLASVHGGMRQAREVVTPRLLAAIANPHVDVIAHPSGRLLGRRPPIDYDWEAVFSAAAAHDTALEIDGAPERLDLSADLARRALAAGVKLSLGSDAHRPEELGGLRFGVTNARRAGATAADVIATWPLAQLQAWLGGRGG
jgi:DNA polymerase (family 10)